MQTQDPRKKTFSASVFLGWLFLILIMGGIVYRFWMKNGDIFMTQKPGDVIAAVENPPQPVREQVASALQAVSGTLQAAAQKTGEMAGSVVASVMPEMSMNAMMGGAAPMATRAMVAYDMSMEGGMMAPGAPAMPMIAIPGEPDTERYPDAAPNPVKSVAQEPVSTFSADVDTAAYANMRRFLEAGRMPPKDAVRAEELINYFRYAYPMPENRDEPFKPSVAVYPSPWNKDTQILQIGIRGYDIARESRPATNLVFLLDVSGSMDEQDKLPLVKQSLRMLANEMGEKDKVAIVVYAGAAGTVLEPTSGKDKAKIIASLDQLQAGGSTAGAEGIRQAYELAKLSFDKDAVNRVILATDGDFNVGIDDPEQLEDFVSRERDSGVFLTVLGFGEGNYNDVMMQKMAQAGNGVAAYIDSLAEARKVLVDEVASSLFTIAGDVKFQVEFNPARVAEYRLIGYETRMLRREDFSNDKVDAGDIGAGHTVTALYEITPPGSKAQLLEPLRYGKPAEAVKEGGLQEEIAMLRIRYKLPGAKESRLIERPVSNADVVDGMDRLAPDYAFAAAVAGFAQVLRGEPYLHDFGYPEVLALAQKGRGDDLMGYRGEFIKLVRLAESAASLPTLETPPVFGPQ